MVIELLVLSFVSAVVWIVAHTAERPARADVDDAVRTAHADPIMSYIDENYGLHVPDETMKRIHDVIDELDASVCIFEAAWPPSTSTSRV